VLAGFEPKDKLDRLAVFVAEQAHDLGQMVLGQTQAAQAQARLMQELADAMTSMIKLQAERLERLEGEVATLRGSQAAEEKGRLQ
jgi:hypothetical protein